LKYSIDQDGFERDKSRNRGREKGRKQKMRRNTGELFLALAFAF
jgi:hypothetical protein